MAYATGNGTPGCPQHFGSRAGCSAMLSPSLVQKSMTRRIEPLPIMLPPAAGDVTVGAEVSRHSIFRKLNDLLVCHQ